MMNEPAGDVDLPITPGGEGRSLHATRRHYSLQNQSDATARLINGHGAVMICQANQPMLEFSSR